LFTPIPFPPTARLPRKKTPSYAKALADKARKTNYKRRNGGLLTKGSALLFPYSEPVKPFGDALCAEG